MRTLHFNKIYHAALEKNADLLPQEDYFIDEFEQGSIEMTAAAKLASEGKNDAAKWLVKFHFANASHAAYGAALAGDKAFVQWLHMRYNAKLECILDSYAEGGHFNLIANLYGLDGSTINLTGTDIDASEAEKFIENLKIKDDKILPIIVKATAKSDNHQLTKIILKSNEHLIFLAILGSILGQQDELTNGLLSETNLTDDQENTATFLRACTNGFNGDSNPTDTVYGLYGLAIGGHWNTRTAYKCSQICSRFNTPFQSRAFFTMIQTYAIAGGHINLDEPFVNDTFYYVIKRLKNDINYIRVNHLQYCNLSKENTAKIAKLTLSNKEDQLHFLASNSKRSITEKLLSENIVSQKTKETADNIKQGMNYYSYFIAKQIVTHPLILRFLMSVTYIQDIANAEERAQNTTWGLLPNELLCLVLEFIFEVPLKTNEIAQLLFSTKKLVINSALASYQNKQLRFLNFHKKQRVGDLTSAIHSARNLSELKTIIDKNKNHKDDPIKDTMQRWHLRMFPADKIYSPRLAAEPTCGEDSIRGAKSAPLVALCELGSHRRNHTG